MSDSYQISYLKFFLFLSPCLSQTQAPEEAVLEEVHISLEGALSRNVSPELHAQRYAAT